MSPEATESGSDDTLPGLRKWFAQRGHSLYVEMAPGKWIARYPAEGQPIGAGRTALGRTALDAAVAARSAYEDGEQGPPARRLPHVQTPGNR